MAAADEEIDHVRYNHKIIGITRSWLRREELRIGVDEAFGWLNYTSK